MSYIPRAAQGQCEYRPWLWKFNGISTVSSAALGEFTEVKAWSLIFKFLKIKFDSKEVVCAVVSFLNYCQTSIYLIKTDIATEFWGKPFVCLQLKFSAGGNVLTDRFIGNNFEHVVALKVKCATVC
jgi:hypothetical protein